MLPLGLVLLAPAVYAAKPWSCDVRSWVRAPDLHPGHIHPGETRLAFNGSDCGDIVRWQMGLVFKERGIVKTVKEGIQLPERPEWNANQTRNGKAPDWDSLYTNPMIFGHRDAYSVAMDKYSADLAKPELWDVLGLERVVFDETLDLPFESSSQDSDLLNPFFVHMPDTNFPPMTDNRQGGVYFSSSSDDKQTLETERMAEYYHRLHLANGSFVDIRAGRLGFIPKQQDEKVGWPQRRLLSVPERRRSGADYPWRVPDCDVDNVAEFAIKVTSAQGVVRQGTNVTLNITVERTGNSTEYPIQLELRLASHKIHPWLHDRIPTEAYDQIQHRGQRFRDEARRMLMATPLAKLERDRNEREEEERDRDTHSFRRISFRDQSGRSQYSFEDEMGKDVYEIAMDVPIPYNAFPPFETTFETITSNLMISLQTVFTCESVEAPLVDPRSGPIASIDVLRDVEWTEYQLPATVVKAKAQHMRRQDSHTANMSLPISISDSATTPPEELRAVLRDSTGPILHYMTAGALGPVLTLSSEGVDSFPPLGQTLRRETQPELRKTRYTSRLNHGYVGHPTIAECLHPNSMRGYRRCNEGGQALHAAKLWQGRTSDQGTRGHLSDPESISFVVQE